MGIGSELWFMRLKFPFTCVYNSIPGPSDQHNRESRARNGFYTRLGVKPICPRRIPDPRRSISDAFDGNRAWEIQPEVGRIKFCDGTSE